MISFGPCQTPTLAFCVEQHEKVEQFKSKFHYSLTCFVELNGKILKLDYLNESMQGKDECLRKIEQIKVTIYKLETNFLIFILKDNTLFCVLQ